jgi:6-phosphogluconate dehydrogenase (decarboxylating)
MELGMMGLGRMGSNMARRLREKADATKGAAG